MLWHEYQATEPFDLICLARSPSFTPAAADAVYDEIRSRFIDENAMSRRGRRTTIQVSMGTE